MHIEYKKLRLKAMWLLAAFAFMCLHVAKAETVSVTEINIDDYQESTYTITSVGTYKITGKNTPITPTSKNIKVEVDGEVNITIENVNISTDGSNGAPFDITQGSVNLTLSGNNSLVATGNNKAGLRVAENTSLTITEESNGGTLRAQGSQGFSQFGGAGIGSNRFETAGLIKIKGGTIRAEHGDCAAGIGGGYYGHASTITINGGHITAITHTVGGDPASIGGGGYGNGGTISITGGTVIALYDDNSIGFIGHSQSRGTTTSFTITGGSVYFNPSINSITPKDGNSQGLEVVQIDNLPAKAKITSLSGVNKYFAKDIQVDTNGSIYLWLPKDSRPIVDGYSDGDKSYSRQTLIINKDGSPWSDHRKTFTVKKGNVGSAISGTDNVFYLENGEYTVYANSETTNQTFTVSGSSTQDIKVNYYTVTYNFNGGSGSLPNQVIALSGETVTVDNNTVPARTYYTFKGWGETNTATEKVETITISGTTTLYAIWEPVGFTVKNPTPTKATYGNVYNWTITAKDLSDNLGDANGLKEIALAEGSGLPEGLILSGLKVSGTPTKAYEASKVVTFNVTANNGATQEAKITFKVDRATLTVTPTTGQSIYKDETASYVPSFEVAGIVNGDVPAYSGQLRWDENSKVFTLGSLALIDNGSFKADNYNLVLAGSPGSIEIKDEDIPAATSSGTSGANNWFTDDITLQAPDGFEIKPNIVTRSADDEWPTSLIISNEGEYEYEYLLRRKGQPNAFDEKIPVKLDKTPPTLTVTTNYLDYTLTFGDGEKGSGMYGLIIDGNPFVITTGTNTYKSTSTAGKHKAEVTDYAGHKTEIEFTLKEKTSPSPPPVDQTVYYTVTLPSVEGAATDPVAGDYKVESWSNFRFYLTLDSVYNQSIPVVTTDRGDILTPRTSDGAYIVDYVRTDVEIYISDIVKNPDPVANEAVKANVAKVWKANGHLYLQSPVNTVAYIYTVGGNQHITCKLKAGEVKTIQLLPGVYFVRIGDESFKIAM